MRTSWTPSAATTAYVSPPMLNTETSVAPLIVPKPPLPSVAESIGTRAGRCVVSITMFAETPSE